jgi:hypothetical protein
MFSAEPITFTIETMPLLPINVSKLSLKVYGKL